MVKGKFGTIFLLAAAILSLATFSVGQKKKQKGGQEVRTVSIPISIYTKKELKTNQAEEFLEVRELMVREDKDDQVILSIRNIADAPLSLAVLIQEDLSPDFNLHLGEIKKFIRNLPRGSRVMVAYLRGGSLLMRQKFTDDLEAAAKSVKVVTSNANAAPRSPYDGVNDILNRFDALPAGRRAVLLFSDGLDTSQGFDVSSPSQSTDLDRAILSAQRRSTAVYSFYSPASLTRNTDPRYALAGQGGLNRIAKETGGRAFFSGSIAPISFDPYFLDLGILLKRQFLLSYLSTHMNRGYHKVEVLSTNPEIEIQYPKGYYYR